jgi:hypothetical protein
VLIHLAAEHAAELELAHAAFKAGDLGFDLLGRGFIVLGFGKLQELAGIAYRGECRIQILQFARELGALAPEGLGALGVTPDSRLLELAADFL